jgi:hypothetical protein
MSEAYRDRAPDIESRLDLIEQALADFSLSIDIARA